MGERAAQPEGINPVRSIRFHLDEHMDPDIAAALWQYGIDITTTVEQELRTEDDERHFERACLEDRVIVTDDVDFLRLAASTVSHPGIVFCRRTRHTLGEIIQFLLLVHGVYTPDQMRGRVEYL